MNLKLLVQFKKIQLQALEILQQVYGNHMSGARFIEWYKRFKEGCDEVKDDINSDRPSTIETEINNGADYRLIVRMIASQLDIKKESVWKNIMEDLNTNTKEYDEHSAVSEEHRRVETTTLSICP